MKKLLISLYNQAVQINQQNILDLVKKQPSAKVLDLGCGDGQFSLAIAKKIQIKKIHGVDFSDYHLKKAQKAGLKTTKANLNCKLPFSDCSFDIIIANQVIEHLADIDLFLTEIFRILKRGGQAIIATENGSSWINIIAAIFGWQIFSLTNISAKEIGIGNPLALHKGEKILHSTWTHKTIFNFRGFKEIFPLYGFEVKKIVGAGYFPLPAQVGKLDPRHAHFLAVEVVKS